jgi:SAM-dependent methyltransferase
MVANVRLAIAEAERVLRPGGRLIVAESCVPPWFYRVEKVLFRPLVALSRTRLLRGHPPTIQIPFRDLISLVGERFEVESAYRVPPGRWITQFGYRWPTVLTPARAFVVVGRKRGSDA